jgi:hypothetical protein
MASTVEIRHGGVHVPRSPVDRLMENAPWRDDGNYHMGFALRVSVRNMKSTLQQNNPEQQ